MEMPIVVTGASSGIGYELALRCLEKAIPVVAIARREDKLKMLQAQASQRDSLRIIAADLATESGRQQVVEALQDIQQIRALVHNAGMLDPIAPIGHIDLQQWRNNQAINVEAPLFLTQGLLDKLAKGRILNISSGAAHRPFYAWTAYCAAKAALYMLYQQFNLEFAERGISVASVMPGVVDTAMQSLIRDSEMMPAAAVEYFRELSEKHQLISPATVSRFLFWLLTEVAKSQFAAKEWDIYDEKHHLAWAAGGDALTGRVRG